MDAVDAIGALVRQAADQAGSAVVRLGQGGTGGAGVLLAAGKVLTNAHNVSRDRVRVAFADGRTETGRAVAADVDADLAVVDVDTGPATPPEWAAGPAAVGDPVVALALTRDGSVRATFGLVSATGRAFRGPRGRRIAGGIEHTAPLARGSSGGPLLDRDGRLLGVNTHRLGDGFYLAVPADEDLRARVDALARGEARPSVRLGVALAPAAAARRLRAAVGLPERDGLLIQAVEEPSPAARAGLRRGDLIVAAAGAAVTSGDELFAALDRLAADGALELRVVRGTEEIDVRVTTEPAGEVGSA